MSTEIIHQVLVKKLNETMSFCWPLTIVRSAAILASVFMSF